MKNNNNKAQNLIKKDLWTLKDTHFRSSGDPAET